LEIYEKVHVTARTGDTLTVLRGQDGTIAQEWSAATARLFVTAGSAELGALRLGSDITSSETWALKIGGSDRVTLSGSTGMVTMERGLTVDTTAATGVIRVIDATGDVFIGAGAGAVNTATNNTFVGVSAGALNTTGDSNTFFGRSAGAANTTGQRNTLIGEFCGSSLVNGSDNILIGRNVQADATNTSNQIKIGAAIVGNNVTGNISVTGQLRAGLVADATAETALTPVTGALIYRQDTNKLRLYNGSSWVDLN
jgi:hypothetical protein